MICSAQVHRESFFEVYRPLIINIEAQKMNRVNMIY